MAGVGESHDEGEEPTRRYRRYALGAAVLSLVLLAGACSGGTSSGRGTTLASTFVFGAPAGCATREDCAIGLQNVYGIMFKQIKTTGLGGPITVQALKAGTIQIGEFPSTSVFEPTFVALGDDKHLEHADNIVPSSAGTSTEPRSTTS